MTVIGCSAHKGSVGQGLRSKAAANGAQIVPRSSHFLSQIYAQGGEGRAWEGSETGGAGLGGGGISDRSTEQSRTSHMMTSNKTHYLPASVGETGF